MTCAGDVTVVGHNHHARKMGIRVGMFEICKTSTGNLSEAGVIRAKEELILLK